MKYHFVQDLLVLNVLQLLRGQLLALCLTFHGGHGWAIRKDGDFTSHLAHRFTHERNGLRLHLCVWRDRETATWHLNTQYKRYKNGKWQRTSHLRATTCRIVDSPHVLETTAAVYFSHWESSYLFKRNSSWTLKSCHRNCTKMHDCVKMHDIEKEYGMNNFKMLTDLTDAY